MARITSHINRSAGQHARAIKRTFAATQDTSPAKAGALMYRASALSYVKTTTQPKA